MSEDLLRDGWMEWDGRDLPSCEGDVKVKFRDGDTDFGEVSIFRWNHINSAGDIIAWRPADPVDLNSALSTQVGGEHYKKHAIQPVEFITKNKLGFLEGCVIKRICRYENKNGLEDLKKAKHEIDLLIELKYGRQT